MPTSSRCGDRTLGKYGTDYRPETKNQFPRLIENCDIHYRERNIILGRLIALRARASLARNVGLGLWLGSKPKVGRTRKSSEKAAPRRSVERNSNSRRMKPGFSKCLYLFSSAATSTDLNCPDCGELTLACSFLFCGFLAPSSIQFLLLVFQHVF